MDHKNILLYSKDLSCLPLKAPARKNKNTFLRALSLIGSILSVIVLVVSTIWCFAVFPHLLETSDFFMHHAEELAPVILTANFTMFAITGMIIEKTREVWLD